MSRPPRNRIVSSPPQMIGFKPYGIEKCKKESVNLTFDEFQGFKYMNYDLIKQDEAAAKMGISRPTFTRLYNSALKKSHLPSLRGSRLRFLVVMFNSSMNGCGVRNVSN